MLVSKIQVYSFILHKPELIDWRHKTKTLSLDLKLSDNFLC